MDIKVFLDKQCGANFKSKIEEYKKYLGKNKYKTNLIIVFSNNFEFVKDICKKYPKPNVVVNITENLSEYHMSNTLKYVSDICYFKTDVKKVVKRILKTYERLCINESYF